MVELLVDIAVPGLAGNGAIVCAAFLAGIIFGLRTEVFVENDRIVVGAGAVIQLFARYHGHHAYNENNCSIGGLFHFPGFLDFKRIYFNYL